MTATVKSRPGSLAAALRLPVRNALVGRADGLRRTLPDRPDDATERWRWWQSMDAEQQRRATLLEHLDALCGHLDGRQTAPGCAPGDELPKVALEAVDGFTDERTARQIAAYRAARP